MHHLCISNAQKGIAVLIINFSEQFLDEAFCDIQNNQGRLDGWSLTVSLIILDIAKTDEGHDSE